MYLTGLLDLALGAVQISLEVKQHNIWWSFLFGWLGLFFFSF